MQPHPGKYIGDLDVGKDHAGDQNGHHNDHKEEAGAAAGVVPGLEADIVHRQLQPLLVAEDGLVLRPVVGKDPPYILHAGA